MDVIFVGHAVPEKIADNLSGISIAGNKMQLNVIKHMAPLVDNFVSTTVYPVSSFRKDGKLLYGKKKLELFENINTISVPFLNIVFFKQFFQIINLYIELKHLIKQYPNAILFTFNMYPQIGFPAKWIKKKYGNKIVCLLADLPIDDDYSRGGIRKFIHKLFNNFTENNIRFIDKVIVLNEHAWEKYAPQAEHIVIDGGIDIETQNEPINKEYNKSKCKNVLYSGSLNEYSGIKDLIQAMNLIQDREIVLDIYGDGNLRNYVEEKCNSRIRYFGKISNQEMIKKQREAWVLINPRPIDDEIAKVTFPSKIFEYMNSGRPVISTRLNGFNKDYEGLILFAESSNSIALAKTINYASKETEEKLLSMALEAKKFLATNKTWKHQVEKIVKFMN